MVTAGSTMVRRQLGRRLARLREDSGKARMDVVRANLMSEAKLSRIENGQAPVKVPDVWALCRFYDADEQITDMLAGMAVATTGRPGWWEDYDLDPPEWFKLYLGLEEASERIQLYESELVHGLLQTADYAGAVFRAAQPSEGNEAVKRYIRLRLQRQEAVLNRPNSPQITATLDEGVLRRRVGGVEVMAAQIEHLRQLSRQDNIDINVLPFDVGAHAAMLGAFAILEYPEVDDPAVVYIESQVGARYLETESQLAEYRRVFDLTIKQSIPIEEWR